MVYYLRFRWRDCASLETESNSETETLKIFLDKNDHIQNYQIIRDGPPSPLEKRHCRKGNRSDLQFLNWIWMWTTVIVLARLRQAVRKRHGIAGYTPFGFLEDLFCAFYCGCCTVSQLARQTADYKQERSYCCSSTGLADEWTEQQEALEQRHRHGHNLVHARGVGAEAGGNDEPEAHIV